MSSIAVAGITRTEAAMRAMTKAAERMRSLETEANATFAEVSAAREACRSCGLSVEVEVAPGIAAAYSEWKQRQAAEAGRHDDAVAVAP